jgi:hypothetical protein
MRMSLDGWTREIGILEAMEEFTKLQGQLVVFSDAADLAAIAMHARRLQGHAQTVNRGADVFLADEREN